MDPELADQGNQFIKAPLLICSYFRVKRRKESQAKNSTHAFRGQAVTINLGKKNICKQQTEINQFVSIRRHACIESIPKTPNPCFWFITAIKTEIF